MYKVCFFSSIETNVVHLPRAKREKKPPKFFDKNFKSQKIRKYESQISKNNKFKSHVSKNKKMQISYLKEFPHLNFSENKNPISCRKE